MLTGLFAALSCGLLGNFLVLRRLSLMGDAISHAVLPGLVAAFIIAGTRATLPMFLGAAVAGILAAVVIELVRRLTRLETGAAMGVVFSVFFAGGVVLLEQAAARHVDLDPDCVLHGMLETVFWFPPDHWSEFWTWHTLAELPRQVWVTGGMTVAALAFILVFFKELRISAFDPALATSLGLNAGVMHFLLIILVAAATVAAFEAVGSILVIAMLICPAATARMLTDRLWSQVLVSAACAAGAAIGGYILGAFGPGWVGMRGSVSATGMMTAVAGLLLFGAILLSPTHGILAKRLRQLSVAADIAREDALGLLYRISETQPEPRMPISRLREVLGRGVAASWGLRRAERLGEVMLTRGDAVLTDLGRRAAVGIVRSHRLWESYLVGEAGIRPDHVHEPAEMLEHVRAQAVEERLSEAATGAVLDPHSKPIPRADDASGQGGIRTRDTG